MINKRNEKICELLEEKKFLSIKELSKIFMVSENSIRRDLHELDKNKRIIIISNGSITKNELFQYKNEIDFLRKKSIAKKAASFINNGDTIIIDGGTTTKLIIKFLKEIKKLTIFSPSIDIAYEVFLLNNPNITLISPGGILDYKANQFFPYKFKEDIQDFNFDKGFLSASGIDLINGVTNENLISTPFKDMIIRSSKDFYFLIDSSKFAKSSLEKICNIKDIHNLITDADIDEKVIQELQKTIPNLIKVDLN